MDQYKKPYLILWGGISDALKAIERCNYGLAVELLKNAQSEAEEAYIEAEE